MPWRLVGCDSLAHMRLQIFRIGGLTRARGVNSSDRLTKLVIGHTND